MQHVRTHHRPETRQARRLPEMRFQPVVHLLRGDIVNSLAETPKRFEERVSFGAPGLMKECISPALWIAHKLETAARVARDESMQARPIIIEAPIAAMMHPDTPMACEAAASRSHILPQEFCIEVEDATLAQSRSEIARSIEALRRHGFRVGVDARRTWCSPLDTSLRLMLDSVRINADELWKESDLRGRVDAAANCGMAVIAEHAFYRDAEDLADLGVDYACRPRADA